MPVAEIVTIADAVTTAINDATLSQTVEAERVYVAPYDLKDLAELRVNVIPGGAESEQLSRSQHTHTKTVEVVAQKRTDRTKGMLDALTLFVEEIADLFRGQRLDEYEPAYCSSVIVSGHDPDLLDQEGRFVSVVSLTFEVRR